MRRRRDGRTVAEGRIGSLPPTTPHLRVGAGDRLRIRRSLEPGRPAPSAPDGSTCGAAEIGCELPAVFDAHEYVEAGGLMSYGPNIDSTYRRLATYVDKLLHGTSPGELPIEQPTTFELVVNKRTADTIGIALPPTLLARADEVIE